MSLYGYVSKLDPAWEKVDRYVKKLPLGVQGFIGGFVGMGVDHAMFGPPGDNLMVYTIGGGELYPGSFAKWLLSYYSTTADSLLQLSARCTSYCVPLIIDKIGTVPYIGSQFSSQIQNFNVLINRLFG
jgi:hypothetical protein